MKQYVSKYYSLSLTLSDTLGIHSSVKAVWRSCGKFRADLQWVFTFSWTWRSKLSLSLSWLARPCISPRATASVSNICWVSERAVCNELRSFWVSRCAFWCWLMVILASCSNVSFSAIKRCASARAFSSFFLLVVSSANLQETIYQIQSNWQ